MPLVISQREVSRSSFRAQPDVVAGVGVPACPGRLGRAALGLGLQRCSGTGQAPGCSRGSKPERVEPAAGGAGVEL